LHQANIGETLSLIYSPFYLNDRLYDAILQKPVSAKLPAGFDIAEFGKDHPSWPIRFVSTLCPNCGWNLEGQRDSLVLSCKNCDSVWYPAGKKLKALKFGRIPCANEATYLPFWRIRADVSGINLNSYADLISVANLPKTVQSGLGDIPFRFWVPAFKVRPKVFLRLASQVTLLQPQQKLIPRLPETKAHPGTLAVKEAVESLKITLADFMKPRQTMIDRLSDIHIDAKKFTLVFIAFEETHHELLQPDLKLAINKNVLSLSSNL
jgi:hypothetical protein